MLKKYVKKNLFSDSRKISFIKPFKKLIYDYFSDQILQCAIVLKGEETPKGHYEINKIYTFIEYMNKFTFNTCTPIDPTITNNYTSRIFLIENKYLLCIIFHDESHITIKTNPKSNNDVENSYKIINGKLDFKYIKSIFN